MAGLFQNLVLFFVAFLFATLIVGFGWLLGIMIQSADMYLPVTLVVACFMFLYMKYVTQLRLENQSLRIIRDMIEKLPENLKRQATGQNLEADPNATPDKEDATSDES